MLLEVRPGEGGDDAVVFAKELLDALTAYAHKQGVRCSVVGEHRTLVVDVASGEPFEPFIGTHRIQRIPKNDTRGRRHTSTATVALVDALENVSIDGLENECEIQTTRGSGNGGQHRQKNDTAVRVIHRPTDTVVFCDDERSQWRNKQKALNVLAQRLTQQLQQQSKDRQQLDRREQITTGERPVKAFTWNTQRNEVVDHSTGKKWRLSDFRKGKLSA